MNDVVAHYDALIDEGNDPVRDPAPLREYMDKWDGQAFFERLALDKEKSVLEIGVGTGRLAKRAALFCKKLVGIDISPKTLERAHENLSDLGNIRLICGDFMSYEFSEQFDVIYSSLTFMHIEDKRSAIEKIASILADGGILVLSLDKNQDEYIDMGTRRIKIFPDDPYTIKESMHAAGLAVSAELETEFAYIIVAKKVSLV